MKKIIIAASIALSLMASAQAAETYVSQNNVVFSVENARKIEFTGTAVTITYTDGYSSYEYLKDGGAVFAKIKAEHPQWVAQGNTLYVISKAKGIVCQNNQTNLGWFASGTEYLNDGCAVYQQATTK